VTGETNLLERPASLLEETIWLDDAVGRGASYLMRLDLRLTGDVTSELVAEACRELVRRHDRLSSVYRRSAGELRRYVLDPDTVPIEIDRGPSPVDDDAPMDPATGPLARFSITTGSDGDVRVTLRIHHLVFDGTSRTLVARELLRLLEGMQEAPVDEDVLLDSAADLGPTEARRDVLDAALDHWSRVAPAPLRLPVGPPLDDPRQGKHTARFVVDADQRRRAVAIAKKAGSTPLHVLLAAVGVLLGRWGNRTPVVGLAVDLRDIDSAEVVGCGVNVVPVALDIPMEGPLVEVVQAIHARVRAQLVFAAIPARELVAGGDVGGVTSVGELLACAVSYQSTPRTRFMSRDVSVEMLGGDTTDGATTTVALHVVDDGTTWACSVDADPARFTRSDTDVFGRQLRVTIANVLSTGEHTPAPQPALAEGPTDDYADGPRIEAVLADIVAREPDRLAIVDGSTIHSYAELWSGATAVASQLQEAGVRPADAVAIHGSASLDYIVAIVAVLIVGGHYVPIDPETPGERVRTMLARSGARLLLRAGSTPCPEVPGVSCWSVREFAAAGSGLAPSPVPAPSDRDLAYVVHTSGTTGEPKGVAVTHRGVVGLALRDSPFRLRETDGMFVHATTAFDASTFELWSALLVGARCILAPEPRQSVEQVAELCGRIDVTVGLLTPALFSLVVEYRLDSLGGLRALVVGGDVMPVEHASRCMAAHPDLVLLNAYGPSEDTVIATGFTTADWVAEESASMPIGSEVAGTRTYVLDERLRLVQPGIAGELYLGGDRLARGYVGDPRATADAFVPDPWSVARGARMYRTGDVVRTLPDGSLQFLGRRDSEIKVRGFRVNLAEIQAIMASDRHVSEAFALAERDGEARHVVGYVRFAEAGTGAADAIPRLRDRLRSRVPAWLVPDRLIAVDVMPRGITGKIDATALRGASDAPSDATVVEGDPDTPYVRLASIWTRLTSARADADSDLFDNGGSSLTLLQLIEEVRRETGAEIPVGDLYELPTFGNLVALTERASDD
jgi:amino acid adenylation domain-containing protein